MVWDKMEYMVVVVVLFSLPYSPLPLIFVVFQIVGELIEQTRLNIESWGSAFQDLGYSATNTN